MRYVFTSRFENNEKYKESYNKWSNIKCINRDLFYVDSLSLWEEYENYIDEIIERIEAIADARCEFLRQQAPDLCI